MAPAGQLLTVTDRACTDARLRLRAAGQDAPDACGREPCQGIQQARVIADEDPRAVPLDPAHDGRGGLLRWHLQELLPTLLLQRQSRWIAHGGPRIHGDIRLDASRMHAADSYRSSLELRAQ